MSRSIRLSLDDILACGVEVLRYTPQWEGRKKAASHPMFRKNEDYFLFRLHFGY